MSISINKTAETVEFLNPTSKKTCATPRDVKAGDCVALEYKIKVSNI